MSGIANSVLSDIAAAKAQYTPPPSATAPPTPSPTPAQSSTNAVLGDIELARSGKIAAPLPPKQEPSEAQDVASGLVSGLGAQTLGAPVDIASGVVNAVTGAGRDIAAKIAHPIETLTEPEKSVQRSKEIAQTPLIGNAPPGGSQWWNETLGAAGLPTTENTQPTSTLGKTLQQGPRVAGAFAAPGIAGKLATVADLPRVGEALSSLSPGSLPANAAIGAGAGAAGELAAEAAPDQYAPAARVAGETIGGIGGGLAGGVLGVGNLARNAMPPMAAASREAAAGNAAVRTLEGAASDPEAAFQNLQARVDADNLEKIPGAKPTTPEAAADSGMLALQRVRERQNDELGAAVTARDIASNKAQHGFLEGMAPKDTNAEPAQAALKQHLANIDTWGQVDLENARAAVAGAHAATGSALSAADQEARDQLEKASGSFGGTEALGMPEERAAAPAAIGAAMRDPAQAAYVAERKRLSALRDSIDPSGTMGIGPGPIKAAVSDIKNTFKPESGAIYSGAENHLYNTADSWGNTIPIEDAFQFRANINGRLRQVPDHSPQEEKRLLMLKSGVDQAISDAVGETHAAEQAGTVNQGTPPIGERMAGLGVAEQGVAQPQAWESVFTPTGREVGVRYAVRDLASENAPIASHTVDVETNPQYPQALQPRDRTRAASTMQIRQMAPRLQPERLGASATPQEGAPIIGPDQAVESGNGRLLAIQHAYEQNMPSAQAYREWLQKQGYKIEGMQQPALVRERTTPLSDEERVAFARESNISPTAGMSATEQAALDANKMSPGVLSHYAGGDITRATNRDFARSFARNVASPGEENQLFLPDGALSVQGAQRIRNALLQRAYGDSGLVGALSEAGDEDLKSFGGALADASGEMSRLRGAIERGAVEPDRDIAPALVDAARLVKMAKDRDRPLFEIMAQHDAFNPISEETEAILKAAYGENFRGRVSRAKIGSMLAYYADEAERLGKTQDLFGEQPDVNQLLKAGVSNYERNRGAAAAARKPVSASFAGIGIGESGAEAQRPELGTAGSEAAAAEPVKPNPTIVAEQPPALTPPTEEAKQLYSKWNGEYGEMMRTFQGETAGKLHPVGKMLQKGGPFESYRLADAEVPLLFVDADPKTARLGVQRFLAATPPEAHEALDNAFAFSLRKAAQNPQTGELDLKAYKPWFAKHEAALSERPELLEKFNTAVKAQQQLNGIRDNLADFQKTYADALATAEKGATNDHLNARNAFTKSVAGMFMGDDVDKAIGRYFTPGPRRTQNAQALMKLVAGNKAAVEGVQRATIDHIVNTYASGVPISGSALGSFKAQKLQDFIAANHGVLDTFFPNGLSKNFDALAEDLKRSQMVPNAKLKGGSDTVQLQNAAKAHEVGHGDWFGSAALGIGVEKLGEKVAGVYGLALAVPVVRNWLKDQAEARQLSTNNILDQMILDPKYALEMRAAYPSKSSAVGRPSIIRRFGARVMQSAVQAARARDLTGGAQPAQRASGGRLDHRNLSVEDQGRHLADLIEAARKRHYANGGGVRAMTVEEQGAHLADMIENHRKEICARDEAEVAA